MRGILSNHPRLRKGLLVLALAVPCALLGACGHGGSSSNPAPVPSAAHSFVSAHPSASAVMSAAQQAMSNPKVANEVKDVKSCSGLPQNLSSTTLTQGLAAANKFRTKASRAVVYQCVHLSKAVIKKLEPLLANGFVQYRAWHTAGLVNLISQGLPVYLVQAGAA